MTSPLRVLWAGVAALVFAAVVATVLIVVVGPPAGVRRPPPVVSPVSSPVVSPAGMGLVHTSGQGGGGTVTWHTKQAALAGVPFLLITKCDGPGYLVVRLRQSALPDGTATARQRCPDKVTVTTQVTLFESGVLDILIDAEAGAFYELTIRQ